MRFALALVLSSVVAGCGSRSGLLGGGGGVSGSGSGGVSGSGSGGVSGSGSGGVGGSGGVSGSGGAGGSGGVSGSGGGGGGGGNADCFTLQLVSPLVEVATDPKKEHPQLPALAASSDDGQQVTVAFLRDLLETSAERSAAHASFLPWQVWPDGVLGPVYGSSAFTSLSLDLEMDRGDDDHVALLLGVENKGAVFLPDVSAKASGVGTPAFLPPGVPRFVSRREPGQYLVGTQTQAGELFVTTIDIPANLAQGSALGCASGGVVADAEPWGDGWIVATSNGVDAPQFDCNPAQVGPAVRLDLFFVEAVGGVTPLLSMKLDAPPTALATAPHPEGAYVVWHEQSGGAAAPVQWLRVLAADESVVGPNVLSGPTAVPLALSAAALGDRLAVAWVNDSAANPANLVVALRNPDGSTVTDIALAPSIAGRPAIVGSPDGHSMVVSWATDTLPARIQLLRLDCVSAP